MTLSPDLWSTASYEPHLLSLPFALAPAALLIVIAYTAVMRGSARLRGFLLAHCLSLLPYATVVMLSPSIVEPRAAETMFRVASAWIPLAAAAGAGFQLSLIRRYRELRVLVWILIANALVWVVVIAMTGAAVGGVQRLAGFWFPVAGPWAWVALANTVVISTPGFVLLGRAALFRPPSDERRQLRAALVANLVTYAGLGDVALSYGIGVFPFGWLLSGIGSLLVVRALVVEDLLRVRAVDTMPPLLVAHFAGAVLLGWVSLAQVDPAPWWAATTVLALSFVGVRSTIATIALIDRGARGGEGPLERLLAQLVRRGRTLTEPPAIAQLAHDIVDLGVGVRPKLLLASEEDWGWTDARGEPLAEELAPDPLLVAALVESAHARGTNVVFADDLEVIPEDLRDVARQLFERHDARAIVLVVSADELLGVIVIDKAARLRSRRFGFVERVAERLAEALLHARMARRAAERAALAREVELAATVQAELLPGRGPHVHGDVSVVGSWRPATRCAGDFWAVYPLAAGRVLIAIGDVTGHGVASAMVTAAAVGACDVCVRRDPDALELGALVHALDAAVRRVGGGELAMTCFAAILDPSAHEIRFVSCGHTAPYLCRPATASVELHALVGRGNPLGSGAPAVPRVQHKPLQTGDLVVVYTDGVIEAQDPSGRPYGDRRLQHVLKRLDAPKLAPQYVHDIVQAGIAAHRAGRPPADDETVVVAQLGGGAS
ncbi:MAG TPA: SpoIIE family protein phosphatase [Kofleriaceae bacterium]|nr:SpoIIE family protein phosphatase [Kofleriaceae bacterium]